MDSEFNSESAINLSRSQGPSAATTPIITESPSYEENDEPEVSHFTHLFLGSLMLFSDAIRTDTLDYKGNQKKKVFCFLMKRILQQIKN